MEKGPSVNGRNILVLFHSHETYPWANVATEKQRARLDEATVANHNGLTSLGGQPALVRFRLFHFRL